MTDGFDPSALRQEWKRPADPRPIVIVGAGGIVSDAHMPAYRKAGFEVAGIYDIAAENAQKTAAKWEIPRVLENLEQVAAEAASGAVIDMATPPGAIQEVLAALPEGATVLIQKPMGTDLEDARGIRGLCRDRNLTAAVNFQLRFSPMMLAVRDAVDRDLLGDIADLEVHLSLNTPWHLFPFLKSLDRVEIAVHSIHYLDLIRSFLGEPSGVYARTVGHPESDGLKQTRTSAILDYGSQKRCCLSINHNFRRGPNFQAAHFRFDGLKGTAVVKLGLLLNYPEGEPDEVWIATDSDDWRQVPLSGGWFPDAFIGTMSNLQRFAAGEDETLVTAVEDAYRTMALVEACYESNASGATPIPD